MSGLVSRAISFYYKGNENSGYVLFVSANSAGKALMINNKDAGCLTQIITTFVVIFSLGRR